MARKKVFLICEECLARNYQAMKRPDDPRRLELRKYCPTCGRYTVHKESK